jgi:hypothetical protein
MGDVRAMKHMLLLIKRHEGLGLKPFNKVNYFLCTNSSVQTVDA